MMERGVTMATINILNKVFSKNVLRELIREGESDLLNKAYYQIFNDDALHLNNHKKIEQLYNVLKKNYRNEYFFKNTMLNKLLLGKHALNTTVAMTELPIKRSKADFILINGKAIVYEIKTKLDALQRLDNQIMDYYTVFDHVEIIVDEAHLNKVKSRYLNTSVGISVLSKKNTISQKQRPSPNRQWLNHIAIYKVLRKEERKSIIKMFYGYSPEFDQFSEYQALLKMFQKIEIEPLYEQFIQLLKQRDTVKAYQNDFKNVPYELRFITYFSQFRKNDYHNLNIALGGGKDVLSISKR